MECNHNYEIISSKTIVLVFGETIQKIPEEDFEVMANIAPLDVLSASKCSICGKTTYGVVPNNIRISQLKVAKSEDAYNQITYLLQTYPEYYIEVCKKLLTNFKNNIKDIKNPSLSHIAWDLQREIRVAEKSLS